MTREIKTKEDLIENCMIETFFGKMLVEDLIRRESVQDYPDATLNCIEFWMPTPTLSIQVHRSVFGQLKGREARGETGQFS